MITDLVLILVLILVVSGASLYIFREKKKGKKCIGCPYAGNCGQCEKEK